MNEPDIELLALRARIVTGERGVVFLYPQLRARVAADAVHVFSVEVDAMELLPSAKVNFAAGESEREVQPVRIVNPTGIYVLCLKLHTGDEAERSISCELEFPADR